jgi:beta-lysine 5,6-aminomutase beta subunit
VGDINLKALKPYGDTTDDGALQLSFTLPVEPSARAREAATQLLIMIQMVILLTIKKISMS